MTFASESLIRSLAGNLTESEISSDDMAIYVASGDRFVIDMTNKDDWSDQSEHWADIQLCASLYAASILIWKVTTIQDTESRARELRRAADDVAQRVNRSKPEKKPGENPSIIMEKSDYRSTGLNNELEPYKTTLYD